MNVQKPVPATALMLCIVRAGEINAPHKATDDTASPAIAKVLAVRVLLNPSGATPKTTSSSCVSELLVSTESLEPNWLSTV